MARPAPSVPTLIRALLGLIVGLGLAELAFAARDRFGFPHVNIFVPDPDLGLRLRPRSGGTIVLNDNPPAAYTTGPAGWRSGPVLAKNTDSIVIVGDSQVFGLGVEDDQTVAARLSHHTGRPVHNGGVPTYGPEEYLRAMDELLGASDARTAVLVINFANDLFELGRPNATRHAAWDGWAVRIETAPDPAEVWALPGRGWLMSQSHLVHALRRWWHGPTAPDAGLPSEGDWEDVLAQSLAPAGQSDEEAALRQALVAAVHDRDTAARAARAARAEVGWSLADTREDRLAIQAIAEQASPGDIVGDRYSEAARAVPVTAELLRSGARVQRQLRREIEAWIRDHPDHSLSRQITATTTSAAEAEAEIARIAQTVAAQSTGSGPLAAVVDRAAAITAAHGAALVVVALPLDVQVDPARFAAYDSAPRDMDGTLALLDQLVQLAQARGHRALSVLPALREGGGAGLFLDGDLHLRPEGQDLVAQAIAAAIAAPAPPAWPGPGLAPGRSRVPLPEEWAATDENLVRGSSRNHCQTWRVREWQRVHCTTPEGGPAVESARAVAAPAETMVLVAEGLVDVVLPVLAEGPATVDIRWADRVERLTVPPTGAPHFAPAPAAAGPWPGPAAPALCVAPAARFGAGSADCSAWTDCADAWGCRQGDRLHPPRCAPGTAPAGAAQHCQTLCDAAHPCTTGRCTPWDGGSFCQ